MNFNEYPDKGDLVVCKIKRMKDYGVFVDLVEYNKEGFIHVSEIVSGWVKNIRSHVSEGQMRVGQVLRVNVDKDLIDVSFRRVSTNQEKRKISAYKRANRAEKIFERIAKELNVPSDEAWESVGRVLFDEFGELYAALEAAHIEGADAFEDIKLPKNWVDALVKAAQESITVPLVSIKGMMHLRVFEPTGIEIIKQVVSKAQNEKIVYSYVSAPDYEIVVTAVDYPEAEQILAESLTSIETGLEKYKHDFSFDRAGSK